MTDDTLLISWLVSCKSDPLRYVMGAFPWGEVGTFLEKEVGPNEWQLWVLTLIRDGLSPQEAIRIAVASGHGVGKTTLFAWIIKWAADTAPDTVGVVTANTEIQLKTKTWAALGKWHNLSLTKNMFVVTATAYFSKDPSRERTWRVDAIPWSEKNPVAFQGLHNKGRRLFVLFDEASGIDNVIWETVEGAMTDEDTEILWLVFGNPNKNTGWFRDCFTGGRFARDWASRNVDSRTVPQTNKRLFARWAEAWGEDSDFFRVRVLGQFPKVGEMEFFNHADVIAATTREASSAITDPLALGVDVARFGKNASVIFPRKGRDARTYDRRRYQGLSTIALADKIFEAHFHYHSDGIMIDGGGVGGGVVDACRAKALFVYEVNFGSTDDTPHFRWGTGGEKYYNKRAGMYGALRGWLKTGAIPADPDLIAQFSAIKYYINEKTGAIQLIPKEDILDDAPDLEGLDDIDALALTFAFGLESHPEAGGEHPHHPAIAHEYDPIAAFEKEMAL